MVNSTQSGSCCTRRRALARAARRGFTLLEIMVVVTIIAVLATLVAPRVWQALATSKSKAAQAEVRVLAQQIGLYMMDNNLSRLPDDFELEALTTGTNPYLNNKEDIIDPWNNPYVVIVPGEQNVDFDVMTYGADGEPGGEGEDMDVVNK
ncbi:MAG: type II secretion system protein GspG [Phycisphaerales bacterium]|nr:type II secretion system protein GspG [Phycisphaerales bacterium]